MKSYSRQGGRVRQMFLGSHSISWGANKSYWYGSSCFLHYLPFLRLFIIGVTIKWLGCNWNWRRRRTATQAFIHHACISWEQPQIQHAWLSSSSFRKELSIWGDFPCLVLWWKSSCVESFEALLIEGGLHGLNDSWSMVAENFVLSWHEVLLLCVFLWGLGNTHHYHWLLFDTNERLKGFDEFRGHDRWDCDTTWNHVVHLTGGGLSIGPLNGFWLIR